MIDLAPGHTPDGGVIIDSINDLILLVNIGHTAGMGTSKSTLARASNTHSSHHW